MTFGHQGRKSSVIPAPAKTPPVRAQDVRCLAQQYSVCCFLRVGGRLCSIMWNTRLSSFNQKRTFSAKISGIYGPSPKPAEDPCSAEEQWLARPEGTLTAPGKASEKLRQGLVGNRVQGFCCLNVWKQKAGAGLNHQNASKESPVAFHEDKESFRWTQRQSARIIPREGGHSSSQGWTNLHHSHLLNIKKWNFIWSSIFFSPKCVQI